MSRREAWNTQEYILKLMNAPQPTDELITCIMCGKVRSIDPHVHSQWRAFTIEGDTYYACTAEFPNDRASARDVQRAYNRVLTKIMDMRGQR